MDGLKWEEYLRDINQILEISNDINDGWEIIQQTNEVGGTFLRKQVTIEINVKNDSKNTDGSLEIEDSENEPIELEEDTGKYQNETVNDPKILIKFDYHVLYHLSYAVPYLCFNGFRSDGTLLTLNEVWNIFNDTSIRGDVEIKEKMLSILTQVEHPVCFKPFFALHPCRTAELLSKVPLSQNKVLTFMSTVGPAIHLTMDLQYAKQF